MRIHDILVWIRIRGSMPLTNGSGFGSGSCYFRHWPSRCQQKTNFLTQFFCLLLFEGTFTLFSKIKSQKESQNSRIQGFSYYFSIMMEGSGSRAGSGSIPLTSGSGSGWPKNLWIRIRNTAWRVANVFYLIGLTLAGFSRLQADGIQAVQVEGGHVDWGRRLGAPLLHHFPAGLLSAACPNIGYRIIFCRENKYLSVEIAEKRKSKQYFFFSGLFTAV